MTTVGTIPSYNNLEIPIPDIGDGRSDAVGRVNAFLIHAGRKNPGGEAMHPIDPPRRPAWLFACVHVPQAPATARAEDASIDPPALQSTLANLAREFSPRFEFLGARDIAIDVSGLERLLGDARSIGAELGRMAAVRGLRARVAIAPSQTTALLMARAKGGLSIVPCGRERATLAPLRLDLLETIGIESLHRASADTSSRARGTSHRHYRMAPGPPRTTPRPSAKDPRASIVDAVSTLKRWGLKTLGELAALPRAELFERLGGIGVELQRLARGEDVRPLVPSSEVPRYERSVTLEWPIERLEPLSFVLARLLDPLCADLVRADRGAAVLHVSLRLVTRDVHVRSLQLPAAFNDPRVLRTLVVLDLESHPPPAGIDEVTIAADPAPSRVVQFSMLERAVPSPERLSTLMARLTALLGEGRCGAPSLVDAYRPGAFEMRSFAPPAARVLTTEGAENIEPSTFRISVASAFSVVNAFETSARGADRAEGHARPAAVFVSMLRRFRHPVSVEVRTDGGRPVRLVAHRRGVPAGRVAQCAGPWRTSGEWWKGSGFGDRGSGIGDPGSGIRGSGIRGSAIAGSGLGTRDSTRNQGLGTRDSYWDRDEWDVALSDGAIYRIFRDRARDRWFVDGIVD
ncbi:MAG: hypothetical protein HYX76_07735 [Acidobacteria bacterium]|nr:hypothetical protein [Acidobacteriota bacterium]